MRAIAGNDILGSKVTLIGGTAFSEVVQNLQRVETGRFLHVRPVDETEENPIVWCMAWIRGSGGNDAGGTGTDRYTFYFKTADTPEAIAILSTADFSTDDPNDWQRFERYQRHTISTVSIVDATTFVFEFRYTKQYYESAGFDFLGPIINLKEDYYDYAYKIVGTEVTLLRSTRYTLLDPPIAIPDTSEGINQWLMNIVQGNSPSEAITEYPRKYFGNFARYNPDTPDPPYVAPDPGYGWIQLLTSDSPLNGKVYACAIALSDEQIAKLRIYSGIFYGFSSFTTATVDVIVDYFDSRIPLDPEMQFALRQLRTGVNPEDITVPAHIYSADPSSAYSQAANANYIGLVYAVLILAELMETVTVEVYEMPQQRSVSDTSKFLDTQYGTKIGEFPLSLADATLRPSYSPGAFPGSQVYSGPVNDPLGFLVGPGYAGFPFIYVKAGIPGST